MIIVMFDGQFGFQDLQQPKGQPCRTKLFMPKPLRRAEPSWAQSCAELYQDLGSYGIPSRHHVGLLSHGHPIMIMIYQ